MVSQLLLLLPICYPGTEPPSRRGSLHSRGQRHQPACKVVHIATHAAMPSWGTFAWGWKSQEAADCQWWDITCPVPASGDDHPKWKQSQAKRHNLKGQGRIGFYTKLFTKPATSQLHFHFKRVQIEMPMCQPVPKLPRSQLQRSGKSSQPETGMLCRQQNSTCPT